MYLILKRKNLKILIKNNEFNFYLITVLVVSSIVAIILVLNSKYLLENGTREASFNVISILTTTGFVSKTFSLWWCRFSIFLFFFMVTGSCVGSTAGGIKYIRMLSLVKTAMKHLWQLFHLNAFILLPVNHKTVTEDIQHSLLEFIFWHLILMDVSVSTFALSAVGVSINIITSYISNIGAIDRNVYSPTSNLYFFREKQLNYL